MAGSLGDVSQLEQLRLVDIGIVVGLPLFVGRITGPCGEVGDELGSRVITARLIRELLFLFFLME